MKTSVLALFFIFLEHVSEDLILSFLPFLQVLSLFWSLANFSLTGLICHIDYWNLSNNKYFFSMATLTLSFHLEWGLFNAKGTGSWEREKGQISCSIHYNFKSFLIFLSILHIQKLLTICSLKNYFIFSLWNKLFVWSIWSLMEIHSMKENKYTMVQYVQWTSFKIL